MQWGNFFVLARVKYLLKLHSFLNLLTYNVFPDTYMYVQSDYILISILQLHLLVLRSLVVARIPAALSFCSH